VTFLELFYDLVYVVIISELAHALAGHVNWAGLASYGFLFVAVWWAWLNGTMYHELHGNNDIRTRVFTFVQMLTVASMAVFAHNAVGEGSVGFALSYAAFQVILSFLWWRTGVHDPDHRPLSSPYVVAFLITTALFVVSVFVPEPYRFYLWGLALLISLLLPLMTFSQGRRDPRVRAEVDRTTDVSPSAVERFGLFTIIVLGEVIIGVVRGVAGHHHLTWLAGGTATLGMLIGIGLWWGYFDFVSHHLPRPGTVTVSGWMYLHLPMTAGMAAVGAAVLNVVEHAGENLPAEVVWLLVGAVAVVLVSVALLMRTIQTSEERVTVHQRAFWVQLASSVVIVLLGFANLPAVPLLALLLVVMLAPIFYGFKVWLGTLGPEEHTLT
jgi:low temperature requirement protein LtrA